MGVEVGKGKRKGMGDETKGKRSRKGWNLRRKGEKKGNG
jgi:hypothetical protein